MTARNKEVIEKVNAAFARNDVEAFLSYCTDDFEWTMVGGETGQAGAANRTDRSAQARRLMDVGIDYPRFVPPLGTGFVART